MFADLKAGPPLRWYEVESAKEWALYQMDEPGWLKEEWRHKEHWELIDSAPIQLPDGPWYRKGKIIRKDD